MGGLARQGNDVTVLTSRHPEGLPHEVADGVEWIYLDAPLDMFSAEWKRALPLAVAWLGHVDVIHSQSSSAIPLLESATDVPVVLSLHGNFVSIAGGAASSILRHPTPRSAAREAWGVAHVARRHFRRRNWRVFRSCHAIVPSVSQVRPSIIAHALQADRVHVVVNAVDTDTFRPRSRAAVRAELELDPDVPTVAIVGRLDRNKGTTVALEGIAKSVHRDVSTVVVGDGPDRPELERLVAEWDLKGRVRFTGRQPQQEVARYLSAADLFVFPSRLAEAGPLVVAQAMSCGTPVVASNVGAVPEMLGEDEEAGLLVRRGSATAMANAIDRLLGDPESLVAMGHAARRRAVERFTVDRMVEETSAVYRTAIEEAHPPARERRVRSRAPL